MTLENSHTGRQGGVHRPSQQPTVRVVAVIAALILAALVTPAVTTYAATTYTVNSTADSDTSTNEYACTHAASGCTLRAAISVANGLGAGASVIINLSANTTYNITAGELDLFSYSSQTITIAGAGSASTIINGDSHHLVFAVNISQVSGGDLDYPQLTLSGLTIQDGRDDSTASGNGANAGFGGGALEPVMHFGGRDA